MVCDARRLPFADASLRGIVMVDALHHLQEVELFFAEADRTLREGGRLVMLEPWNTWFAWLVYGHLHPEPFSPGHDWSLDGLGSGAGPLSRANGALPWIVFERDRERFQRLFPGLAIVGIELDYPFSYLASGGVSCRALAPSWCFDPVRAVEKVIRGFLPALAIFALITLEKRQCEEVKPAEAVSPFGEGRDG
jgi:hypothetical protein